MSAAARSTRNRRRVAALALALLAPGCVSATFRATNRYREVAGEEELVVGQDDLGRTLEVLGAPLLVRENGEGAVLAWGWARERGWGVRARLPGNSRNVSFDYAQDQRGLRGLVLFFDDRWTLTASRRGRLADVLPPSQERARLIEGE